VAATARIAGIMAAKQTAGLIPLCHPLQLSSVSLEVELVAQTHVPAALTHGPHKARHAVRLAATVKTAGQTGVEMEALTAASVAALTVYDMVKALDKAAVISGTRLIAKNGGKSGDYKAAGWR